MPATVGALAERLHIKHHSAVELVDRLCARKLVARRRSRDDRRQVIVEMRPAGRAVLERLATHSLAELQNVGPALIEVLTRLMAPFVPFITEEVHERLVHDVWPDLPDSVHLRDFPQPDPSLVDEPLETSMEAVRRTVELGRAARAQAGVKVRQPLRRAIVVATDAEREAISARGGIVTSELNVKELEFVAEESALVSYEVRPNYRSLGPRFGRQMPQVAAAVGALDAGKVSEAIEAGLEVGINVEGRDHTLAPEDLTLVLQPLDGYQVEAAAGHAVALALELDDELRREGLAREIVHAVQSARRESGLEVTDRIELKLAGDAELLDAARAHEAYLAGETLATSVSYDGAEAVATQIDGRELRIAVERSS